MTTPRAGQAWLRLPARQPARALTATACYLATVAAVAVTLTSITNSPIGVLFSIGISVLLLVPLAVLAPREPASDPEPELDLRPVLQRGSQASDAAPHHRTSERNSGGDSRTPPHPRRRLTTARNHDDQP